MKNAILLSSIFALLFLFIGFQKYTEQSKPSKAFDKQSLQRQIFEKREMAYVYPDQSPLAQEYLSFIENLGKQSRWLKIFPVPASGFDTLASDTPVLLLGTPEANPVLKTLLPDLPFHFEKGRFIVNDFTFDHKDDRISFSILSPEPPYRHISILTGNSEESILKNARSRRQRGAGDYTVYRGDKMVVYGFFNWTRGGVWQKHGEPLFQIKPELEINFLRERAHVLENEFFVVDYAGKKPPLEKIRQFVSEQQQYVERQLKQLDLRDKTVNKVLPIPLLLHETADRKAAATQDSRFSHWLPGEETVHIVFSATLQARDFTAIAEYIAYHWAGEIPNSSVRTAAGLVFSEDWGGEGYPVLAGRLFHNGYFLPVGKLFTNDPVREHSKYITAPQLATFLQFILFHDGADSFKQLLRNTPATMTASEAEKRIPPSLRESWNKWCKVMLSKAPPEPIVGEKGFHRGFCFAHEGYRIYNGYLGSTSKIALDKLAEIGANAVSITPFGYPRGGVNRPVPLRKSDGVGSENDESLVVSAAFAREHGMQVMLKPHIWIGGGAWPGDIKMTNAADWEKFFAHYEQWMTHYAILAQMHQFESLVVGVELVQATVGHENAWRKMVANIRRLYGGKIIYAANWGEEAEKVTFWDAFDAIGINCYYPLSKKNDVSDAELLKGAKSVAEKLGKIAEKYEKPLILTEVGFASRVEPWIAPHKDGRRQRPDANAQKRCYEALFNAFYHQPWLTGMYLWKWPTSLENGGENHPGFTPNGKEAEEVVRAWYSRSNGNHSYPENSKKR